MPADWEEHYRDECDAVFLYRRLASLERDEHRRDLFARLADVEDRHVARWADLFKETGQALPAHRPSLKSRALVWTARQFGSDAILPLVLAEEGREVQAYLGLARGSVNRRTHAAAVEIAADSAEHARELASLMGRQGEPWHTGSAGGYLRSIVYGFNDGLTANFGLVAGVIGASVAPHVVIISGVSGALADALSMGSSGYLAAKSEAEMHAHQIETERIEMKLMPELEEEELALIYEARGLPREHARATAKAVMNDPGQALDTMMREELNIQPAEISPFADGAVTGSATAIGAIIPLVPFFVLRDHSLAIWTSLVISMAAHFAIGAARSFFTGRGILASGRDMFFVGFGVAAVAYVIGEIITRLM